MIAVLICLAGITAVPKLIRSLNQNQTQRIFTSTSMAWELQLVEVWHPRLMGKLSLMVAIGKDGGNHDIRILEDTEIRALLPTAQDPKAEEPGITQAWQMTLLSCCEIQIIKSKWS